MWNPELTEVLMAKQERNNLEIPVQVTVMMEHADENKQAFAIYKTLLNEHYKEPVDGDLDATASILEGIRSDSEEFETDM